MKNFLKLLIITLFIELTLGSCTNTKTLSNDFFPMEGKNLNSNKVQLLEINVQFSECGEWGGHKENIKIYTKSGLYYLEYYKYCVDCSIAMNSTEEVNSKLIFSKVIELDKSSKIEIIDFSKHLLESKFYEKYSGNSGNYYYLKKHKTMGGHGFDFGVYGYYEKIDEKYIHLLKELGIKNIKDVNCILETTLEEYNLNELLE